MSNVYKALSALLSYPTRELQQSTGNIRAVIRREARVPEWALRQLDRLLNELSARDLYELQERYVFLFDRTRSLSLHLFEHVHGESRDRGQAMVDLQTLYARGGLEIEAGELPDFLPLFLEFLSTRPAQEARALLAEPVSVIAALKERLAKRKSPYAAVFRVLEAMAARAPEAAELDELRRAPDADADDLDALDAAWEDAPVTFGPGEPSCPKAQEVLDRMRNGMPERGAR